jgi:hypothetical protein
MSTIKFLFFLLFLNLVNSNFTNNNTEIYNNGKFNFLNIKDSNLLDPDVIVLFSTMIILIIAIFTYSVLNLKNKKSVNGSLYIKTEKTLPGNTEGDPKSGHRNSRRSRRLSVLKKVDLSFPNLQNDEDSKSKNNEEVVFDNVVVIKKKKNKRKKIKEDQTNPGNPIKVKKIKKIKKKKIKPKKDDTNSNLEISNNLSNIINLIDKTNPILQEETNYIKEKEPVKEVQSFSSDSKSESNKEEISNKDIKLNVSVVKSNAKSNAISLVAFSKLGHVKKASPKKKINKPKNNQDEIKNLDTEGSKNSKLSAKKIVTGIIHRDIIQYTNEDRSISDQESDDEELEFEEESDESMRSEVSEIESESSEDPTSKNLPQIAAGSPNIARQSTLRRREISNFGV